MSKKMNILKIKSKGKIIIFITFLILLFIVIYIKQKRSLLDVIKEKKTISRREPVVPDNRHKNSICSMCDETINSKFKTIIKAKNRDILFCSPHCYFIYYSSLINKKGIEKKVYVTDWVTGASILALNANYTVSLDSNRRPVIKAFEKSENSLTESSLNGGNILKWKNLKKKEMSVRCAFCDRVIYPEDGSLVKVNNTIMYACCAMCGLGVTARLQKDIELTVKDGLTGQLVNIQTMNGKVSSLKPETAVAWAGKRKNADGKMVSAGCFKQRFFIDENNLRKWLDLTPGATGKMVTIHQALAAKIKLTQKQINNACKIDECK